MNDKNSHDINNLINSRIIKRKNAYYINFKREITTNEAKFQFRSNKLKRGNEGAFNNSRSNLIVKREREREIILWQITKVKVHIVLLLLFQI